MQRTKTYECMCLLDNREVRKGWESLKTAVAGLFTKHGAKVLSSRRWDERRLAYPMKGQLRATYLLIYFSIDTNAIPALRRELEFSEEMLRYMITDCAEVPADAYEPEAEFDVASIPVDDAPEPAVAADDSDDDKSSSDDGDDSGSAVDDSDEKADEKAKAATAADGGEEPK